MKHLSTITVSIELVQQLISLGITPQGLSLWHINEPEMTEVKNEEGEVTGSEAIDKWNVQCLPDDECEFAPGICVPAWTKEEIEIMLGFGFAKPDVREPSKIRSSELPDGKEAIQNYIPVYWVNYFPEKEVKYPKGADASADLLCYLLRNGGINPWICNRRYFEFYKKEKKNEDSSTTN